MKKYISIGQLRFALIAIVIAVVVSLGAFVSHPKIEAAYDETKNALQDVLAACEVRVIRGANLNSFVTNHRKYFNDQSILAFDAARNAVKRTRAYPHSAGHYIRRYWIAQRAYKLTSRELMASNTAPPSDWIQLFEAMQSADEAVEAARLRYNAKVKIYNEARSGPLATPVAYLTQYEARPLLE